jgi:hypothetical protein
VRVGICSWFMLLRRDELCPLSRCL